MSSLKQYKIQVESAEQGLQVFRLFEMLGYKPKQTGEIDQKGFEEWGGWICALDDGSCDYCPTNDSDETLTFEELGRITKAKLWLDSIQGDDAPLKQCTTTTKKKHYFLVNFTLSGNQGCGNFIQIQKEGKHINSVSLKQMNEYIKQLIQQECYMHSPQPTGLITNISYLGEMTDEEFGDVNAWQQ